MLATAKQEKYGIPVSGRVDVSIAKKLKEEANTLDLSMSRMVHVALSEWANAEDNRAQKKTLESDNQALQTELNEAYAKIKEWEDFHSTKVESINKVWQNGVAKFIHSLTDNGKKLQEYTKTFNEIFNNV